MTSVTAAQYRRAYPLRAVQDIHTEDVNVISRDQKGLDSGTLMHIHFMGMEGLCRHLYRTAVATIEAWQEERKEVGESA